MNKYILRIISIIATLLITLFLYPIITSIEIDFDNQPRELAVILPSKLVYGGIDDQYLVWSRHIDPRDDAPKIKSFSDFIYRLPKNKGFNIKYYNSRIYGSRLVKVISNGIFNYNAIRYNNKSNQELDADIQRSINHLREKLSQKYICDNLNNLFRFSFHIDSKTRFRSSIRYFECDQYTFIYFQSIPIYE